MKNTKNITELLFQTQQESLKNKREFHINLALDDVIQELYQSAQNSIQQKMQNKGTASEQDSQQMLIEELRLLLTGQIAKTDLLDLGKYEMLRQAVQRWCPWKVERQASGQLVRQLWIAMLPEIRQKQQLQQICREYTTDLTTEIESGLQSHHPTMYMRYHTQKLQTSGSSVSSALPPDPSVKLRVDPCQAMDQFVSKQASQLKNPCSSLVEAIANYRSVRILSESLKHTTKPVTSQLQDFRQRFSEQKPLLDKNQDSAAVQFIKRVMNVLSWGRIQRWGFWQIKGQEISKRIEKNLGPLPTSITPQKG